MISKNDIFNTLSGFIAVAPPQALLPFESYHWLFDKILVPHLPPEEIANMLEALPGLTNRPHICQQLYNCFIKTLQAQQVHLSHVPLGIIARLYDYQLPTLCVEIISAHAEVNANVILEFTQPSFAQSTHQLYAQWWRDERQALKQLGRAPEHWPQILNSWLSSIAPLSTHPMFLAQFYMLYGRAYVAMADALCSENITTAIALLQEGLNNRVDLPPQTQELFRMAIAHCTQRQAQPALMYQSPWQQQQHTATTLRYKAKTRSTRYQL